MRRLTLLWTLGALLLATEAAQAARPVDLCGAVTSGQLRQVQRALKAQRKLAQVRCRGEPVLHHAILKGAPFEVLLALLHAGSDVNQPNQAGDTPLLLAVRVRDVELVKLLFQYGADPERRNAIGVSAIDEAQQIGRSALLEAMGVPVRALEATEAVAPAVDAAPRREDAGNAVEDARGPVEVPPAPDAGLVDARRPDLIVPPDVVPVPAPAPAPEPPAAPAPPAAPVAVEEEAAPATPETSGAGRKLLLSLLIVGGIALAMRLLLRLAR